MNSSKINFRKYLYVPLIITPELFVRKNCHHCCIELKRKIKLILSHSGCKCNKISSHKFPMGVKPPVFHEVKLAIYEN